MSFAATTVGSLGARITGLGKPRTARVSTKTAVRSANGVAHKPVSLRVFPTTRPSMLGHDAGSLTTRVACNAKADDAKETNQHVSRFHTRPQTARPDSLLQPKSPQKENESKPKPWWAVVAERFAVPAALAIALLVVTVSFPGHAVAASSGGRMGGSSFRASSMSRSYSTGSSGLGSSGAGLRRGSSSGGLATSAVLIPMGMGGASMMGGSVVGGAAYGGGGLFSLLFGVMVILAFLDAIKNAFGGDASGLRLGADRIAVVKIQIGLLGLARQLQLDLEDIANAADTSTTEGLHYVLEETVLTLLRNPEFCVYGYATSAAADGPEQAEDRFNEFCMDERGKFEEETLVNVNNRKRAGSASKNADGAEHINEYILVTIIAACDGGLKLPAVLDSAELKTALKRVGAIRVDALQAVEVLWTPQESGDTLSEDELLADYPRLNIL